MKSIFKLTVVLLLLPFGMVIGQTTGKISGDSLTLNEILNEVIHNYPSIKKAQTDLESSDAKIGLAKTAYLPNVDATAAYTLIGPTSTISIPGLGSFQMNPASNYSAMLSVTESIYDFGKTQKNIAFEKQSRELAGLSVEQLKQKLSGMMVGNFYSILFLQEAIKIKDEEMLTLKAHFNFVEKKEASGSATKYELLTTKVRISANESQKTDLLNALQIQLGQLNSFLGKSQDTKLKVKKELFAPQIMASNDSLFSYAFDHRNEIKVARQKTELANSRLGIVNAQNNPSLNFIGAAGFKNGYIPDLAKFTPNFVAGVSLKVPLFDANRSKYTKIQAQSEIKGNVQETDLTRRAIVNEVVESKANAETALKKVNLSELQLEQAEQAHALAETSFKAGVITNVELMYSYTAVTDSKLALLKTKIDYSVSLLKLKIALGEQIY
jgi:outer membrane protein